MSIATTLSASIPRESIIVTYRVRNGNSEQQDQVLDGLARICRRLQLKSQPVKNDVVCLWIVDLVSRSLCALLASE